MTTDHAASNPGGGWPLADYRIQNPADLLTPALAIYSEAVDANLAATLRLLEGRPDRWRPHVKTAKLAFVMRQMVRAGITHFKCSTTLELATLCELGAEDVLLAYPVMGANARRAGELARRFPRLRIAALIEHEAQIQPWPGSGVGLFIDLNPGMDRTGIDAGRLDEIVDTARKILAAGLAFRGLHQYEGHLGALGRAEREAAALLGYARLLEVVGVLERAGIKVSEVVTSGTPAFPNALACAALRSASCTHRVSPGTVIYNDTTSLAQLPPEIGYRPAALVVARVVSHPSSNRVTCDAGHKAVSADAGVPTCAVLGYPELRPLKPSEEHLPIEAPAGSPLPALGELLYLLPRHICPTVNNFDHALIVSGGLITALEPVTARGHEAPLIARV